MADIIVKLGDQVVQSYPVSKDTITIGRARDNEIVVENLSVSRNHARIRRENGKFILTDLSSANGSFLNGVKVTTAELKDNDIISIGKHKLHFMVGSEELTDEVEAESVAELAQPPSAPQAGQAYPFAPGAGSTPSFDDWGFLLVTRGKQVNVLFRLQPEETSVGRANENDIRLHDWFVSKRHAIILRDAEGFLVRDLGSWRGITLNGAPIRESRIKAGDELVFGTTVVRFHAGPEDYHVEGAILSTELPSDVSMPEAAEGFSSGEPAEYSGQGPQDGAEDEDVSASLDAVDIAAVSSDEDDEYAPLTDEELAQLELEHDEALEGISASEAGDHAKAEWEQLEADRMMAEGAGWRKSALDSDVEEDATFPVPDSHALLDDPEIAGHPSVEDEDEEEESVLFGGPVSSVEPGGVESAPPGGAPAKTAGKGAVSEAKSLDVPEGVDPNEFRKWSRGLRNKSRIVRREAARKLKELTGTDYEWESEPE